VVSTHTDAYFDSKCNYTSHRYTNPGADGDFAASHVNLDTYSYSNVYRGAYQHSDGGRHQYANPNTLPNALTDGDDNADPDGNLDFDAHCFANGDDGGHDL
jgi:hypothetical protein